MAFPTIHGIGPYSYGTGALNPALPSGVSAGMLLFLEIETAAAEPPPVSGWTALPDSPVNNSNGTRLTVFRRYATGSGDAPTVSDSGDHQSARVIAVNGVHASAPIDVTASATGDTTAVSISGDTTTGADELILIFASHDKDKLSAHFSGWANADLANLTEHFDNSHDAGNGGGIAFLTGEKAAAGAFGATTSTGAEDAAWAALVVAVIPGAAVEPSTDPPPDPEDPVTPPTETDTFFNTYEFDSQEDDPADREPIAYYLAWQMMDNSAEAMSKLIDKIRVTAKGKSLRVQIHAASPNGEIDRDGVDDGTGAIGEATFEDSQAITRYAEEKVKFKNLSIWTARYSGIDDGQDDIRDRLDELIIRGRPHGTAK
jgi:hypothetical protein